MPTRDWRLNHQRRAYQAARDLEEAAVRRTAAAELPLLNATLARIAYSPSSCRCFSVSLTRRCSDGRNELGFCLFDLDVDEQRTRCLACGAPESDPT